MQPTGREAVRSVTSVRLSGRLERATVVELETAHRLVGKPVEVRGFTCQPRGALELVSLKSYRGVDADGGGASLVPKPLRNVPVAVGGPVQAPDPPITQTQY